MPTGPSWLHEVKWDGMRVLVRVASRHAERDLPATRTTSPCRSPSCAGLADVGHDLVLDGEVVALADGVPSFAALADRIHVHQAGRARALAAIEPRDPDGLRPARARRGGPHRAGRCHERRAALEGLGLGGPSWQVPGCLRRRRAAAARRPGSRGWRGSCRRGGTRGTDPGRRTPDWLKFPHRPLGSFVVGGWRSETDSATPDRRGAGRRAGPRRAALPRPGRQRHRRAGRASGCWRRCGRWRVAGLPVRRRGAAVDALGRLLGAARRSSSTWSRSAHRGGPAAAAGVPGLRADLTRRPDPADRSRPDVAQEVRVEVDGRTLRISNLDKVLYPGIGHDEGGGAALLRPGGAGAAAAPGRPGGHPDPLAGRHRRQPVLREEPPGRGAVAGSARSRCPRPGRAAAATRSATRSSRTPLR